MQLAGDIKTYKPRTPSYRFRSVVCRTGIYKGSAFKGLISHLSNSGGRNSYGRKTVAGRSSFYKSFIRRRNSMHEFTLLSNLVSRKEYNPSTSSWLSLVQYSNRTVTYATSVHSTDALVSTSDLTKVPSGTLVNSVCFKSRKFNLCSAAGSYAQLLVSGDTSFGGSILLLRSGEQRYIPGNSTCLLGVVSNVNARATVGGKAGHSRWLGRSSKVRGVAKNPVDHPHGGAGGANTGRPPVTPNARGTKGTKTRNPRKTCKSVLVSVQTHRFRSRLDG